MIAIHFRYVNYNSNTIKRKENGLFVITSLKKSKETLRFNFFYRIPWYVLFYEERCLIQSSN